jgi:GMP synthase (glutamine-hydrolysing)
MAVSQPVRPQISVLDTGGQYTHLITRKIRELGVYADIQHSDVDPQTLCDRVGIVISGGPASVTQPDSPQVDPRLFQLGIPVLGICYGLQLMAFHLGGQVAKGSKGEYGPAVVEFADRTSIFSGLDAEESVWMSHFDTVIDPPPSFKIYGSTDSCRVAAAGDAAKKLFGVQFHPEVIHTPHGKTLLSNFLFSECGCRKDWDPKGRVAPVLEQIQSEVGDRNVLFFVSGGVDSTVAYTLCLRALGDERVRGYYVDTGLMRAGETSFVQHLFAQLGSTHFEVVHAQQEFVTPLAQIVEPEQKRKLIGEQFVTVQDRLLSQSDFASSQWVLGQGTIYPDTIESGGTKNADLIKTHHNRVGGIQKLIEQGRVVEPLALFYKDEVREIGVELGIPQEFLDRHPFPGPGLAIRCLCSNTSAPPQATDDGWILPLNSVGVQGDSRTYRPVIAIQCTDAPSQQVNDAQRATEIINRDRRVNRAVAILANTVPIEKMATQVADVNLARLDLLRKADAVVRKFTEETGVDQQVWQFPVILLPFGTDQARDSVVLRPIASVDGMTAQAVTFPGMDQLAKQVAELPGIAAVFLDLTHKPPGTIEWE